MLKRFLERIDWSLVAAFPLAAAVVHIITTFIAMNETSGTAHARLSAALPANTMTMLKGVMPETQPVPFTSSDARLAVCPFDTSEGALDVRVQLPDLGWTVGVYKPDGTSVYFAAAEPGRRTAVSLLIVPDEDRFLGLTPQSIGKSAVVDPQLTVAARTGMVVVRAPDSGAPYTGEIEKQLLKSSCGRSNA